MLLAPALLVLIVTALEPTSSINVAARDVGGWGFASRAQLSRKTDQLVGAAMRAMARDDVRSSCFLRWNSHLTRGVTAYA